VALKRAVSEVHGVDGLDEARVEAAGRTDLAIARDLLVHARVAPEAVAARAAEVGLACAAAFAELCPPDLSATVAPGVPALLAALAAEPDRYRLALLTGNLEPVARLKLARAGLGEWFAEGPGAFGSDAEAREVLPAIARARAATPAWPRHRTVVIGDTPRDIACARADGIRVAAVATGPFGLDALGAADAAVRDAPALAPVLARWA
jgi:phosphoglycolate phosphatase-like HAD superfamily hydrolase